MKQLTVFSALLLAGLSCTALAVDIKEDLQKAYALSGERKHDEAIRLLADAVAKPEVSFEQQKEAAFRVANYIHSIDRSHYPMMREKLEEFLKIKGLTDSDKKVLLDSIYGTYSRVNDNDNALKTEKRILELKGITDKERADVLDTVARLYIHHYRDLDTGRVYFHQCLALRRKAADALEDPLARASKLKDIGYIYRIHAREFDKAKAVYLEAASIYKGELPKLQGSKKARVYVSLVDIYDAIGHKEEETKAKEDAVAEYIRILDGAKNLSGAEWVKVVSPGDAMASLKQTPEGARKALELADKMVAMKDDKAVRNELNGVLNWAVWIAAWGPDATLRPRASHFLEEQVALATTPDRRHYYQLQLGESYFRRDRALGKARKVFAEIANDPESNKKDREVAEIWCEMLSDTGQ